MAGGKGNQFAALAEARVPEGALGGGQAVGRVLEVTSNKTGEEDFAKSQGEADLARLDSSILMLKHTLTVTKGVYQVSSDQVAQHVVCGVLQEQLDKLEEERKSVTRAVADGKTPSERLATAHKHMGQVEEKVRKTKTRIEGIQNRLDKVQK